MMGYNSDVQLILKPLGKVHSLRKLSNSSHRSRNSTSYGSLSKHLPQQSIVEKEDLYLEALALKVQLNDSNDLNVRLKAKVAYLKKSLDKANETIHELNVRGRPNASLLVSKLKKALNQLRVEAEAQKRTIEVLKKKLRVTKYVELEAEKMAFENECTRLRRQLEDAMRVYIPKENAFLVEAVRAENDVLKRELSRFKLEGKVRRPAKRGSVTEMPKARPQSGGRRLSSVQDQLSLTLRQLQETKDALELERRHRQDITSRSRDRSSYSDRRNHSITPEILTVGFIQKLHNELRRVKKDLETVLTSRGQIDQLTANEFHERLLFSGLAISDAEVNDVWLSLFNKPYVSLSLILNAFGKDHSGFDLPLFDSISHDRLSDISDNSPIPSVTDRYNESIDNEILQHVALRLQLHRISKEHAVKLIYEARNASPTTLKHKLETEPFELTNEAERSQMLRVLNGPLSLQEIAEHLGKWQVLQDLEEEKFDAKLISLIKPARARLMTTCELYDSNQSGVISISEFFTAAKSCGIELEPRMKMYIKLLSYSFEHQLDSAPYTSLIEAFAKEDEDDESSVFANVSELEQEQIVTDLLKSVVRRMRLLGKTPKSAFESANGLLTPNGFLEGLNALLPEKIKKKDFLILLATLQSDNYEDPIIEVSDLETFIKEVETQCDKHPEKLISLLDSSGDFEEKSESFIKLEATDPVKMSSRAIMETQALSLSSSPQSC